MTNVEPPITLGDQLSHPSKRVRRNGRKEFTVSENLTQQATPETIRSKVRDAIRSLAPQDPEQINSTDSLTDDLQFDSLALVELAVNLEQEFDLRGFQDGVGDVQLDTVGDIEDLILRLVEGRTQ